MVFPNTIGSSNFDSWNFLDDRTECMETIFGSAFGTSIPTVPLPGIGAIMRMPVAAKLSIISYSRLRIRDTRIPSFGTIS